MTTVGHRLSTSRVDAYRVSLVTTRSFARTCSSIAMNDHVYHRPCSGDPLRSLERGSISPRRATSAHFTPNPENKAAGDSVRDRSRLRIRGVKTHAYRNSELLVCPCTQFPEYGRGEYKPTVVRAAPLCFRNPPSTSLKHTMPEILVRRYVFATIPRHRDVIFPCVELVGLEE